MKNSKNVNSINNNSVSRHLFKYQKRISLLVASGLLFLGFCVIMKLGAVGQIPSSPSPILTQASEPLTIHCNLGRLGNQMCTLATLYGLSKLNGRKMLIPPCNYEKLRDYFDIKIPVLNNEIFKEKFPWNVKPYFEEKDRMIDVRSNIIKGYPYPCSYTFFNHIRSEIKNLFRFKEDIQKYAEGVLSKARCDRTDVIFVGVHVRRTDYLGTEAGHWLHAFGGKSFDVEYFQKATDYYKEKYGRGKVLFLAVSDDRNWCNENLLHLGIQVTDESPSPAHDLALLTKCNHTIMTYGTFGFWGGYLAGGEVTYFDKFLPPDTEFTKNEFLFDKMYLPHWVGIATNSGHPE